MTMYEELLVEIENHKQDTINSDELFNKYAEQIKDIDPVLFGWMESGYLQDKAYSEISIQNAKEWIAEQDQAKINRKLGAIKGAITRKANKLATA